jgi:PleD family two-component response regulator
MWGQVMNKVDRGFPAVVAWPGLAADIPLKTKARGAVISHKTVTDRKLLEFELERLAATDSLTDLPNRRHLLGTVNLEVERVRRFGAAASVVMIDLDQFKVVSDTCGHTVGDEALRCLTQAHKKCLRQIDVLARIGGEERGGPGCLNRFRTDKWSVCRG